jgi:hypothetical protein
MEIEMKYTQTPNIVRPTALFICAWRLGKTAPSCGSYAQSTDLLLVRFVWRLRTGILDISNVLAQSSLTPWLFMTLL